MEQVDIAILVESHIMVIDDKNHECKSTKKYKRFLRCINLQYVNLW